MKNTKSIRGRVHRLIGAVSVAAMLTAAPAASAAGEAFAAPERVRAYELQVSRKSLALAHAEIDAADLAALNIDADLPAYWQQGYSWAQAQKLLNAYPQYLGRVDGLDLPFYYVRGEGRSPPVLLLTQSAPGSILQLLERVDGLTRPSRHGGSAADAVTVVIASLPGSSFSSLTQPATSDAATAQLWHQLLTQVIGARSYQAHGDGIGAGAVTQLLRQYPRAVVASAIGAVPVPATSRDALLTDLLLSRLDQNGMESNLRLSAAAQSGDAGFWPTTISKPIVLPKMRVDVSKMDGTPVKSGIGGGAE